MAAATLSISPRVGIIETIPDPGITGQTFGTIDIEAAGDKMGNSTRLEVHTETREVDTLRPIPLDQRHTPSTWGATSPGRLATKLARLSTMYRWPWIVYASIICLVAIPGVSLWKTLSILDNLRDTKDCPHISGNLDTYGIGIRVGTYMQLAITILVNTFGGKYTSIVAPANIWFLIALFVAMSPSLLGPEPNIVEIYIILLLGNGIVMITLSGCRPQDTYLTRVSRFVACILWRAYATIYWWWVLPRSTGTTHPSDCGPYGWMLIQANLTNGSWLHTVNKVFNVLGLVNCLLLLLTSMVELPSAIRLLTGNIKAVRVQLGSHQSPQLRQLPSSWWILVDCFTIFPAGEISELLQAVCMCN